MLDISWLSVGGQDDGNTLYFRLRDALACHERDIIALIKSSPWARWQPRMEDICHAARRLNLLHENGERPSLLDRFPIATRNDAQTRLILDKDKMVARVLFTADWGGQIITLEALHQAMSSQGVTPGQSPDLEQQALAQAKEAEAGSQLTLPVAKGVPPRHGCDSFFEPLVETLSERVLAPRELEHGRVDLRDLGALTTVPTGTPLMRRHPATAGEAGHNVLGQTLPAKPGRDLPLDIGAGSGLSPTDGNLLIALRAGLPRHHKNGIVVDDMLNLKQVDAKHGHVVFNGSLIISGDVEPGMKVKASGDIVIGGFVESAQVEAGGSVTVKQGAIGRRTCDDGGCSCQISAIGDIHAAFAQYVRLQADGNIHIYNQAAHCYCIAGHRLLVGDPEQRRGVLLGGHAIAGESIHAPVIGAPAASHTRLQVEGGLQALRAQEKTLQARKWEYRQLFDKLHSVLAKMQQELIEHDPDTRQRLNQQRQQLLLALKTINGQLEECLQKQQRVLEQIHVIASLRLYPGVAVEMDGHVNKVDIEHGPCHLGIRDGELTLQPWSGARQQAH